MKAEKDRIPQESGQACFFNVRINNNETQKGKSRLSRIHRTRIAQKKVKQVSWLKISIPKCLPELYRSVT